MEREISRSGLVITILAFIMFTSLTYKMVGFWCVVVGPIITILACRPASDNGPWTWEK